MMLRTALLASSGVLNDKLTPAPLARAPVPEIHPATSDTDKNKDEYSI